MNRPGLPFAVALSAAALLSSAIVVFELDFTVPGAAANSLSANIPLFQFEQEAQLHCPDDSVVWATASRGIYNSSADRWYGRTSSGAYGCLHEAENAGYRVRTDN
jgi:hypothetical protein